MLDHAQRSVFGIDRTPNISDHDVMDTEALVIDAFAQLGIDARLPVGAPESVADLVLDPDGLAEAIHAKRRALVTDDAALRLIADSPADGTLLVVADRVTEAARKLLTGNNAGYLDLRGRLAIRTNRLVIDAEVHPALDRPERSHALGGKAGLEVATALLMQPERRHAVRELARELERSPSTVSEILAALRRDGLTDKSNQAIGTDLFWQLADRWPTKRTPLASLPAPGDSTLTAPLRLGLDVAEGPGWALTDSAAAAAYGAPVAFRSGQPLDFFVQDPAILRRAQTLLGAASATGQATLRVAPVPAVVRQRVDLDANPTEWPLAHPLFVALDLATDVGRGREILDAWTPDGRWTRVW
ncbi:hypothetical protein HMPREF0063_10143 [Aeromicrobium marinum DSM 15272]|uniref:Uncharacterized protein n=1 Tax=Aeromicrobium marinum DSM 15272 TaxID=585531 RepID=E2S7Y6_9ACTN|nr:helix-turn-helix domain-containing protein [Aeromicrobium marinum]EFQ84802.1 hypothetical protein HMPREF0063_10143 [Aeromicrobium marinum DSM 15272]